MVAAGTLGSATFKVRWFVEWAEIKLSNFLKAIIFLFQDYLFDLPRVDLVAWVYQSKEYVSAAETAHAVLLVTLIQVSQKLTI